MSNSHSSVVTHPALKKRLAQEIHDLIDREAPVLVSAIDDKYLLSPRQTSTRHHGRPDYQINTIQHLYFLDSAISMASNDIFIRYIDWLHDVLTNREVDTGLIHTSLEATREVLSQHLSTEASSLVDTTLSACLRGYLATSIDSSTTLSGDQCESYVDAILNGKRDLAEKAIVFRPNQIPLADVHVHTLQPAMYAIGELWQKNRISVAQEHMATAITQDLLGELRKQYEHKPKTGKSAVFACTEGNHHVLGLKMVSDIFEVMGWTTYFLGANTPSESIMAMLDNTRPDLVGLSVSLPQHIQPLSNLLDDLRSEFAGSCPSLVVGGQVLNQHPDLLDNLGSDGWFKNSLSVQADLS